MGNDSQCFGTKLVLLDNRLFCVAFATFLHIVRMLFKSWNVPQIPMNKNIY